MYYFLSFINEETEARAATYLMLGNYYTVEPEFDPGLQNIHILVKLIKNIYSFREAVLL